VTFSVPAATASFLELSTQVFFATPGLSAGQHRVEVVHGGNNQTTPLTLQYLVIQNPPAPTSTPTIPITSISTSSSSSSNSPHLNMSSSSSPAGDKHKAPTGAIVGGTVVAVVVIFAVIFALPEKEKGYGSGTQSRTDSSRHRRDVQCPWNNICLIPTIFRCWVKVN
jgi:hypothetical protein